MLRRLNQVLFGGLLLAGGALLFAQTPPAPPGAPPAIPMEGPGLPPGPNASADACAVKLDGGAPYFLRAETKEQRQARIGTAEDPGCDPDPAKVFWRFGRQYTIGRYDRSWTVYTGGNDENFVRPFGFVNAYRELYQQNDKWVWTWELVREQNAPPAEEDIHKSTQTNRKFSDRDIEFLQLIRPEFFPLTLPRSEAVIRFEEASEGLPTSGSWRNNLAVADMNGDGFMDIIVPPERAGGTGAPAIFLGDGKGHWKYWNTVLWPHPLDYGGVAAADFNKDGHMDLVFAVHLQGLFVALGDGKGNFTEVAQGLPRDFPTRRVVVADVDGDGYPDIVAISEGPTAMQTVQKVASKIRVYFNRKKGMAWEGADVADVNARVGGDWLAVGNLNGDKFPDISAASVYFGSSQTIYMGKGPKQWTLLDPRGGKVIPFLSYYTATAAGKLTSKKKDDLLVSYVRLWPQDVNEKLIPKPPAIETSGIDRLSFAADGTATRTPVFRSSTKFPISGLAIGDVNGDGNADIVFTLTRSASQREIAILLGDGKGNFTQARVEGLKMEPKATYDVKLADVNGDGRPDIILMYEAEQATALSPRDGSIRVFLNRGPAAP